MKAHDLIKMQLEGADMICLGYLQDLNDQQFMQRPHPGCNHINWQVGHLIAGENQMINTVVPNTMPPLPEGFAARYTKETASSDDPSKFAKKDELLRLQKEQRAGTLAALAKVSESDFDKPTGVHYAPTVGAMFNLQGAHWLMHAGQWVIVRRQNGKPALF
jgi:hypothetical protein